MSRLSLQVAEDSIRSPRTVQQMQPLFISTICSSLFSMISLSTPTSPNSFSITAMRLAVVFLEDAVEQRGLAAAEKAGEDRDRDSTFHDRFRRCAADEI